MGGSNKVEGRTGGGGAGSRWVVEENKTDGHTIRGKENTRMR